MESAAKAATNILRIFVSPITSADPKHHDGGDGGVVHALNNAADRLPTDITL